MKRLIFIIILALCLCLPASAQLMLSLLDAVSMAQGESFDAQSIMVYYEQSLIGHNPHKREKKIESAKMDEVQKKKAYDMWEIAHKTAALYMSAIRAECLYNMYRTNASTSEMLYRIGQEKFNNTSIRNDELSSLKLQWMNAETSCNLARVDMDNAQSELVSYLGLEEGSTLMLSLPAQPSYMLLDHDKIYSLVKDNNPAFSSLSGVTVRIPIIDQKTAVSKWNAAKYEAASVDARTGEELRSLNLDLDCAIRDFENYQTMLQSAQATMELADEAYSQANDNYANGIVDINTFAIAQSRKENAYSNYLDVLCFYWDAYYRLSMLCCTDIAVMVE